MEESEGYPFVFQMIDRDSADLSSLKYNYWSFACKLHTPWKGRSP